MGVIRISTIVIRATIGAIKVSIGAIRAGIGAIKASIGAIRAGIGAIKASAGAIRKNICDQGSFIIKYFHKQNLEKKTGEAYLSNQRRVGLKPRGVVGLKGKESWF